jgi:LuxR family maltose regulon positive regulatory protein
MFFHELDFICCFLYYFVIMQLRTYPHIITKLYIPNIRPEIVKRHRLIRLLGNCINCKLTFITAPAGYGKTTLLSEWSLKSPKPVLWVSLDYSDNDPARFWSYVVATLERLEPEIGEYAVPLLHSPHPVYKEQFIPSLINMINSISDHFFLILDDFHTINCDDIHEHFSFFFDYIPPNMHIILAGREKCPFDTARLRANGRFQEITVNELRFTADETKQLFNDILYLDLPGEQLDEIQRNTEGWIAGLQLIALELKNKSTHAILRELPEDHLFIVEYLSSEVFHNQPVEIQTFLLETSILGVLNTSLCNAVTERTDSDIILNELHRRNLFITALNKKGEYRYHSIFANFLKKTMLIKIKEKAEELHRRASLWYEKNRDIEQAIDHCFWGNYMERAVSMVKIHGRDYMLKGEFAMLMKWFKQIPEEKIFMHHDLCIAYAWSMVHSGLIDKACRCLSNLEKNPDCSTIILGESAMVRARIAVIRGNVDENLAYSNKSLTLLPSDSVLRGDVILDLAFAYYNRQDRVTAEKTFLEAIELALSRGNLRTASMANYYLAELYKDHGEFTKAVRRYQTGFKWAEAHNQDKSSCWTHAGIAAVLYEWNDCAESMKSCRKAAEFARKTGELKVLMYAPITLAQCLYTVGNTGEALTILDNVGEVAKQTGIEAIGQNIHLIRISILLREGKAEEAERYCKREGIDLKGKSLPYPYLIMLVLYAISQADSLNRLPETEIKRLIVLLEEYRIKDMDIHHDYWVARHSLLLSMLYYAAGQKREAFERLDESMELAERIGLYKSFIDYGSFGTRILREYADRKRNRTFALKLLDGIRKGKSSDSTNSISFVSQDYMPVESLGHREIEVLKFIEKGRSNKEIAEEMIVAVSTVKWYLRNIYSKLNVHRRTQAVAKARELNIL